MRKIGMKLTTRHLKCLKKASMGGPNGENEAQLYTGSKVRQECVDWGLIERMPDSLTGTRFYRTTQRGLDLLHSPPSSGPKRKSHIKTLKPRITIL
jgi:hypothetical protein